MMADAFDKRRGLDPSSPRFCTSLRTGACISISGKPGIAIILVKAPGDIEPFAFAIMSRKEALAIAQNLLTAIDELEAHTSRRRKS